MDFRDQSFLGNYYKFSLNFEYIENIIFYFSYFVRYENIQKMKKDVFKLR